MERPSPPPERESIVGAIAMIVIGLVIFIPSGLCTGAFGVGSLIGGGGIGKLGIALLIGGPFVIGGFTLIWHGVKQLRGRQKAPPP